MKVSLFKKKPKEPAYYMPDHIYFQINFLKPKERNSNNLKDYLQ